MFSNDNYVLLIAAAGAVAGIFAFFNIIKNFIQKYTIFLFPKLFKYILNTLFDWLFGWPEFFFFI